ncbi:hypothetical protein GCM10007385_42180 [Tateyamaria omphalii]|nr:hypothetical protein GCM10007385_42180 [Tateyamaria omphalii]
MAFLVQLYSLLLSPSQSIAIVSGANHFANKMMERTFGPSGTAVNALPFATRQNQVAIGTALATEAMGAAATNTMVE